MSINKDNLSLIEIMSLHILNVHISTNIRNISIQSHEVQLSIPFAIPSPPSPSPRTCVNHMLFITGVCLYLINWNAGVCWLMIMHTHTRPRRHWTV